MEKQKIEPTEHEVKELGLKMCEAYERLASKYLNETYKEILYSYATKELSGEFILPLPKLEYKTYSATDIGNILGIYANKVGRISKELDLKTKEYGEWFVDKSKNGNKEVEVFRYYENVLPKIREYIKKRTLKLDDYLKQATL